jgi:hypothetical protein
MKLPHYHSCEWRLEATVGSRSLHSQASPHFLVSVATSHPEQERAVGQPVAEKNFVAEVDYPTMVHIASQLDIALAEVKGAHCRRIARNIK